MLSPRRSFWVVLLLGLVPLLGWWAYGLFDLDEGFYAAVVAEMNRRGEWLVPYYNGKPWWEKPILLYWVGKPMVAWFGDMVGPRLPSVLAALTGYALVFWWAKRRLSMAAAQIAVLALATSLLWVGVARMMMTDMLLAVALAAAFLTFYESLVASPWWRVACGALLALGVLAKGPVAVMLFLPIAGWTYWRERDLRRRFRGGWLLGTAAFVLVVASWYLPAYLQHGDEFVHKFLVEQNLNRFAGGDTAHTVRGVAGLLMYVPVLLVGMLPWSAWLFKSWPSRGSDFTSRYLATCAAVPFLFFTVGSAKLPHYVLPCCIPIALLVADRMAFVWSEDGRVLKGRILAGLAAGCVLMAVAANVGFQAWYRASGHSEVHALAREIPAGAYAAAYQMPRREKSRGTGRLKLQETSHPSLLLYLNRHVLEAETPEKLARGPMPLYVLTRVGRFDEQTLGVLRANGLQVAKVGAGEGNYELYRLASANRVSFSTANASRSLRP